MEKICVNPLVSICVPAHNAQKYLQATLNALCNQSYSNYEIIIVDDHSTDDTSTIIKNYKNPHIKLFGTHNYGAAAARNVAFKHSKGELILFFDADDLVDNNYIKRQVEFYLEQPKNTIVLSRWGRFYSSDANDFKIQDEHVNGPITLKEWVLNFWSTNSQMTIPGRALIPRKIIKKAGDWKEELSLNDDFEFYTRLFSYAEQIIINPNAVLKYRSGINGLSQQKRDKNKQIAQYHSISLATEIVLALYPEQAIKLACANIYQSFVYECYPLNRPLIKLAENKIRYLGGSNVVFQTGGYTKFLVFYLGWKLTKILKNFFIK